MSTGVAGLDDILAGGIRPGRMYLIEGAPGTGKTTLALQFLLAGRASGLAGLYITLSESAADLLAVAESHGWSLDGLHLFELITEDGLEPGAEQTVLHTAELELGEAMRSVMDKVVRLEPTLVVFDSLSEMRLLAENPLRYRRQVLALKQFFVQRGCTVVMLDHGALNKGDQQLHSISHGVIVLEQVALEFGAERRRLRVQKMRGAQYRGGYHDFIIERGGLHVFPRLVANEHHMEFGNAVVSSGCAGLDSLLGGGLVPGTNMLLVGPAGVGKTSMAVCAVIAALRRGEQAAYFLFDEGLPTLLARCLSLGFDLRPYITSGTLHIQQVDPAEMSPGEFAVRVRDQVEACHARTVVIDSLNAYLQSMPGEHFLLLQMHELLTYLNQCGAVTIMILGQHGIWGEMRTDVDLSYLADTVVLLRYFEAQGHVLKGIAVVKTRTTLNQGTMSQLTLGTGGVEVGPPLKGICTLLAGTPVWNGDPAELAGAGPAHPPG